MYMKHTDSLLVLRYHTSPDSVRCIKIVGIVELLKKTLAFISFHTSSDKQEKQRNSIPHVTTPKSITAHPVWTVRMPPQLTMFNSSVSSQSLTALQILREYLHLKRMCDVLATPFIAILRTHKIMVTLQ